MMTKRSNAHISLVTPINGDDVLATAGDCPVLIEVPQADAVCTSVKKLFYGPYKQEKYVFDFTIMTPQEFRGTVLQMFVRIDSRWTSPPTASKLYKIACIALGRQLQKRERITKAMFENKVFRCQLKRSGEFAAAYTIVEMVTQRLTG